MFYVLEQTQKPKPATCAYFIKWSGALKDGDVVFRLFATSMFGRAVSYRVRPLQGGMEKQLMMAHGYHDLDTLLDDIAS